MTTNNTSKFFRNRKLENPTETNKQDVVSVTYEEIGLFPRSFSRVTDRFLQQIFSDVDNLIIHEYRFYRYLFFTTFKSLLILFCVPFLVNLLAKNYIVRPLTEYLWNSKQTEIFLNTYQQKRAFLELKDFEEKLYFESLVSPPPLPVTYYRLPQGGSKDSKWVKNDKTNSIYKKVLDNSDPKIQTPKINMNITKATNNIFAKKNMLSEAKIIDYSSQFTTKLESPSEGYSFKDFSYQPKPSNVFGVIDGTTPPLRALGGVNLYSKKIKSIVFKTVGAETSPYPNSIYLKKKKLNFNNLNIKSQILDFGDNQIITPLPHFKNGPGFAHNPTLNLKTETLQPRFLKEIININSENDIFYVKFNRTILNNQNKPTILTLQEKTTELAARYNVLSIEAITNFCSDLISFLTLCYLLFALEIQVNITKSFLLEVFFGLDDSKKSLLILLITDLLVGYHSSNIWELFFEFIFDHYGFAESQTGVFLLVATLPVLLDVLFKYLIFRHLNRSSPATVATYHAMIE